MTKAKFIIPAMLILSTISCTQNKDISQKSDISPSPNNPPINIMFTPNTTPFPMKIEKIERPEKTDETKIKNNSDNILGSFETNLLDSNKNRVKNISVAVAEIDESILQPGEVFSFNDILGRRGSSKGYKKAKIINNGEVDWALGGGICQLSSTIYNAAKRSNMIIIEKHSHSKDVEYVPDGQDAAVNYGTMDFKFKNSKNYPIKINVWVGNNKVSASIIRV